VSVLLSVAGCGGIDPRSASCGDLSSEAVKISEDQAAQPRLLKVRGALVLTDHRRSYREPKGSAEALVLECVGDGVYSSRTSKTYLRLSVDADGDEFVRYREATGALATP